MRTAIPRFYTAPVTRLFDAFRRLGEGAATWIQSSIEAWAQTRRHHREVALLQSFDERMLRDVGLTRADVEGAAATPFWRDPATVLKDRAGPRGHNRRPIAAPRASSIVPGLLDGARDLAACSSAQTHAFSPLRRAGRNG
jgi:uncharacterized protein YjiS (DUF1127 family)